MSTITEKTPLLPMPPTPRPSFAQRLRLQADTFAVFQIKTWRLRRDARRDWVCKQFGIVGTEEETDPQHEGLCDLIYLSLMFILLFGRIPISHLEEQERGAQWDPLSLLMLVCHELAATFLLLGAYRHGGFRQRPGVKNGDRLRSWVNLMLMVTIALILLNTISVLWDGIVDGPRMFVVACTLPMLAFFVLLFVKTLDTNHTRVTSEDKAQYDRYVDGPEMEVAFQSVRDEKL
ncbi:hypothetical protein F5Y16DRAFT_382954 [Xylariaceae sp. FL0255]|nr:hypothetical protein F5Y16DRAFT_382954 [Xylariaceae sp. FL0255]